MKERTYTTIERSQTDWGSGPWDDEPDKIQWPDKATGLPCLAVRNEIMGNWCGYVGVDDTHPLHGKDCSDVGVQVHGGVTFARGCAAGESEATGICHVPDEGEPDHVWWIGFDCAHAWDLVPHMARQYKKMGFLPDGTYKTLEFVQRECAQLAAQLASMVKASD